MPFIKTCFVVAIGLAVLSLLIGGTLERGLRVSLFPIVLSIIIAASLVVGQAIGKIYAKERLGMTLGFLIGLLVLVPIALKLLSAAMDR